MNSPDPWRSIIGNWQQLIGADVVLGPRGGGGGGGHHHGGGGGGHGHGHHGGGHHHGGHGHHHHRRPYDIPFYNYGYPYPYYYQQPQTVLVDNRQFLEPVWNPYTRQWEYPAQYGSTFVRGALAEQPRERDGLLAAVAPVLAPATGGVIAKLELGSDMKLSGYVQVDGITYQGAVDLAPMINALLAKMRATHGQWHSQAQVSGDGTVIAGGCGARLFYGVTENKMATILKRLQAEGANITGNNPWQVTGLEAGVELGGRWNPQANTLHLEVTDSAMWAPCSEVWKKLDQHLRGVGASAVPLPPPQQPRSPGRGQPSSQQPRPQAPAPRQAPQNAEQLPTAEEVVQAIDRAVAAARQSMIEALVQQHVDTVASGWLDAVSGDDDTLTMSAGWFSSLKKAAKKAVRGLEKGLKAPAGTIAATLKKYRGPIASAAGFAAAGLASAIPGAGVALGPVAGNLAQKLTLAAAGEGSAKKALMQARDEAKQDPKLAKALGTAEKAVAQTTAAYHIAETARAAAGGNSDAAKEMEKLAAKAREGDKAAQVAMQLADKAAAPEGSATSAAQVSGDYEVMMREIAKTALRDANRKRGGRYAGEEGFVPYSGQALGYRRDGDRQRVYFFDSHADAMKWFHALGTRAGAGVDADQPTPDYVTFIDRGQLQMSGPTGPVVFITERFGGVPIESRASVRGVVPNEGQRTDIKRIEVLDEDGNLTKRVAIYTKSGALPDYYIERAMDSFWMFFDPAGDRGPIKAEELGPSAPADLLGKRYRIEYPMFPPMVMPHGRQRREDPPSESKDVVGTGGPRVEIIGAAADALEALRKQASDAAAQHPDNIVGVVRLADGNWSLVPFANANDADDWFGIETAEPRKYIYAAYYNKADRIFPAPLNESIGTGAGPRKPANPPINRGVATVEGCP